jgi:EpsI family protein
MRLLNSRYARILTLVLLLQAGAFYAIALRPEAIPDVMPLALFPRNVAQWQMVHEQPMEPEIAAVLRADDTLNRIYDGANGQVSLFIAFFKTQRTGQMPHSPKNCLPGSGWEPVESGRQTIAIAGRDKPIVVNRYVVQHGEEKSLTLYWYQSHNQVIASELSDRLWLIVDSIRYRRSDTALVRISVPIRNNDTATADAASVKFVQSAFPLLVSQLPL